MLRAAATREGDGGEESLGVVVATWNGRTTATGRFGESASRRVGGSAAQRIGIGSIQDGGLARPANVRPPMAKYAAIDWYDTPLLYDIVFEEDTTKEGLFLEQAFERFGRVKRRRSPRRVLEPACGSGRLLAEMARRGWRPTGFDLSPPMLDFAAKRLRAAKLTATLREARMESFRFREKFELAHCLVSTFKYLLEEKDALSHLRRVANALLPGGIYVLGFHLTCYPWRRAQHERWVGQRDDTHVVCNIHSWPPARGERRERVRSRLVVTEHVAGGPVVRLHETDWWFRTYDAREVRALLAKVPALEHVATYDFCYDWTRPRDLDDTQLDTLLILRRR